MINDFHPQSRIWIYPSNQVLSDSDQAFISSELNTFCKEWTAHDKQLKASYSILKNRFILLAVDEKIEGASGCSIDKSVKKLKQIAELLGIDFFSHEWIYFAGENDSTFPIHFRELSEAFDSGKITPKSILYNTSLSKLKDMENQFEMPIEQSPFYSRIKVS